MKIGTEFARRYASWIERRRHAIIAISVAFAAIAAIGASRLEIRSDLSNLLPEDARSVRDLRAIGARARVLGTVMVAATSDDPVQRRTAAVMLRDRVAQLPLVSSVTFDDRVKRDYGWNNRWLFAELDDLKRAKAALETRLRDAKLAANPLFIELDEPDESRPRGDDAGEDDAEALRARLRKAEAEAKDSGELVSPDGKLQMMIVRTAFSSGDIAKDNQLLGELERIMQEVRRAVPGVEVGVAGDIKVSVAEHDSILSGMLRATLVTIVLVMLGLLWFFRSPLAVGALSWSLAVGTVATFAATELLIGHLNLATAFLSSIVIGNGINVGILVTSRYFEELRAGKDGAEAIAGALANTASATLAAALTAAVAYASLMITVFRGFRHFGVIGAIGILLCWCAAYIVLPAALAVSRHRGMAPGKEPPLGRWLARLLPNRLGVTAVVTMVVIVAAGVITARFLAGDPFESNFKNLRSRSDTIAEAGRWMHKIDVAFGQGIDAAFVIAVPRREDVMPLKQRLRAADTGAQPRDKLFHSLNSLDDLLPSQQAEKLAVLAEIRTLLSGKDFEDVERAELAQLRPPDDLRVLTDSDVPEALAWPFIEADGSRGKLILATAGKGYEVWDARDTVRFVDNIRALGLPDDVHFGGVSFVFYDVLDAVIVDGLRASVAATLGAILIVLIVVGRNRHGAVTLICGLGGTILMLGSSALLGIKINFLDFVALPFTIGIGIEYAVNIVTRERQDGPGSARAALATTGGAVALCSYTTIVGYGSLVLSQNLGIRSFGLAAMLGELTCLAVAVFLAPALLWATGVLSARRRAEAPSSS